MNKRLERWLYGMISAVISGGASAVTASVTVAVIDPDKFSPVNQVYHFIELAGAVFVMNGFMSWMAYLKQNPLPDEPTGNTEQITKPQQ